MAAVAGSMQVLHTRNSYRIYLTAGRVFVTDCKKGLAPRGFDFLHEVCSSVKIPVYAIGGIREKKLEKFIQYNTQQAVCGK